MIFARFTPTFTNVTTNPVTQWDYGRTLRIEGLKLPTAVRIDFCISGEQETTSRIGITKDGVTDVVIPDSFLEQSNDLVAYVYVNDTTSGKTVKTINIPVDARPKPEEYDSPESKELFAEAIELVNEAAVRAEDAEKEAETHAGSAKESLESTQEIAESFSRTATQAVEAVNDAGTAQIQAINNTKAEAVNDIQAEGATQLGQIQEAGENIVNAATIAEQNAKNVLANAIKGNLSGEIVTADDVSPVEHEMVVKVKSKNLVDINNMVSTIASNNFVSNENGTYTLTKVTDGNSIKRFSASGLFLTPIKANTPFKISCDLVENTSENGLYIALYDQSGQAVAYPSIPAAENKVFTYDEDIYSVRVYLLANETDGTYAIIKNLQIEVGDEATKYTPYIDPATVNVRRCGKNIYDNNTIAEKYVETTGYRKYKLLLPNGEYTWSLEKNTFFGSGCYAIWTDDEIYEGGEQHDNCFYNWIGNSNVERECPVNGNFTVKKGYVYLATTGAVNGRITEFIEKFTTMQLEKGSVATSFEAFKEISEHKPSSDGTVSGMMSTSPNMTILTDTEGAVIECEYIKDTNKVIEKLVNAIIGLGGTV